MFFLVFWLQKRVGPMWPTLWELGLIFSILSFLILTLSALFSTQHTSFSLLLTLSILLSPYLRYSAHFYLLASKTHQTSNFLSLALNTLLSPCFWNSANSFLLTSHTQQAIHFHLLSSAHITLLSSYLWHSAHFLILSTLLSLTSDTGHVSIFLLLTLSTLTYIFLFLTLSTLLQYLLFIAVLLYT